MTPEQRERIRELFLAACEKGIPERAAYLQRASGSDEFVRKEVESLLANDDEADTFLQTPALGKTFGSAHPKSLIDDSGTSPSGDVPGEQGDERRQPTAHPQRIGSYEILEELGRGGMGIVYLAQQDNPRRRVALKLIRSGVTTSDSLGRFAHEAQILGRLQHPGIAQVHEAGTADAGAGPQPYFAMELVDGVPLTQFAETHNLDVPARLELLANVCDAVQHAHQKGVIHRDLKPGNILTTREGQSKILDFGVARATDSDVQATTLQTDIGQLIGTVSYMSPEQASGDPHELDTRSDVYSLGVVLYELLVGRLPYNFRRTMIHEAVRKIREEEPARLSSINRTLRGDVETIVAKAMEKDKTRRYQSASDLAGDIRRYLANEPILARPASTFYQLSKFTRRNRALVMTVTIAFGALGLATIGMTLDRNRAIRAERLAEQRRVEAEGEATKAKAVNDFMERTLSSVDPSQTLGRDVPFRHFLDLAVERIEIELAGQPEVQALVYNTLGRTYHQLGFLGDSESHLRRGLALCRNQSGEQSSLELDIMNHLALTLHDQGNTAEAEPLFRQVLTVRQRTLGDENERTILAINNLGWLLRSRGQFEEAQNLFRQALTLRRKVSGEDHPETLRTMVNLAEALRRLGKMEEAEKLSAEAIATCKRTLGDENPLTLYAMSDRVWLLKYSDRSKEAEVLARRTLELSRKVLGDDHPSTLNAMNTLGIVLSDRRLVDEAETLQRETLSARRRVLGEEHPSTLSSMNNLAVSLYTRGKYAEAEPLYSHVLEGWRRVLGEEHPDALSAMFNLALCLREQGKLDEAEPLLAEVLAARRRTRGDDHPSTLNGMTALAALYMKQNRDDKSIPLLEEAWKTRQRVLGQDHGSTLGSLGALVAVLVELDRFEEAEPLAHECYERRKATLGPAHRRTHDALRLLIELYEGWDKPEQAAEWQAMLPKPSEAAESRAP